MKKTYCISLICVIVLCFPMISFLHAQEADYKTKMELAKKYYKEGSDYCDAELYDLALESYKKAEKAFPDFPALHYNMGWLYGKLGDAQQSINHLQRYIALSPNAKDIKEIQSYIIVLKQALEKQSSVQNTSPRAIGDIIYDAAQLKLIHIISLSLNWSNEMVKTARDVLSKYKMHDLGETKWKQENIPRFTCEIKPSERILNIYIGSYYFTGIIIFSYYGELPEVKFRSGTISISLSDMSVDFSENIECFVNGKTYVFRQGKWIQK